MDTIGKLMLAFVTLIIGIVLIAQVATTGSTVTTTKGISKEVHALYMTGYPAINTTTTYTVTNAPTGWKTNDCPLTSFAVKNQSGSALTLTADYTANLAAGTYVLKNTVNTNTTFGLYGSYNNTYVDYVYCGDDYLNSSWGRTVINLVPGFFALAILLASVALFYSVARDTGIIA